MKKIFYLPVLMLCFLSSARGTEIDDLRVALVLGQVLPDGWKIEGKSSELNITGPEVKVLSPISLPTLPAEVLWRNHSRTVQVQITIKSQAKLHEGDLAKLRQLRKQLREITERAADRRVKGWSDTIKEYGYIRLPDYESPASGLFVSSSLSGYLIQSEEVLETFSGIEKEIVKIFSKSPEVERPLWLAVHPRLPKTPPVK
jgi:hypothetical protein